MSSNIVELIKEEGLNELGYSSLQKGRKLFKRFEHQIVSKKITKDELVFSIPSERMPDHFYEVSLTRDDISIDENELMLDFNCDCMQFDQIHECKHIALAILYVFKNQGIFNLDINKLNPNYVVVSPRSGLTDDKIIITGQTYQSIITKAHNLYTKHALNQADENKVKSINYSEITKAWQINFQVKKSEEYLILVNYSVHDKIEFTCNCGSYTLLNPCNHIRIVARVLSTNIEVGFRKAYNFEFEKQQICKQYQLEPNAPLLDKFKFEFAKYNYEIIIKQPQDILFSTHDIHKLIDNVSHSTLSTVKKTKSTFNRISYLINFQQTTNYSSFKFSLIGIKIEGEKTSPMSGNIDIFADPDILSSTNPLLINTIELLSRQGYVGYAKSLPSFGYIYENSQQPFQYQNQANLKFLQDYGIETLIKAFEYLQKEEFVYINSKSGNLKDHEQVTIAEKPIELRFSVEEKDSLIQISLDLFVSQNDVEIKVDPKQIIKGFVVIKNVLYKPNSLRDHSLIVQFAMGPIQIHNRFKSQIQSEIIKPILIHYPLQIDKKEVKQVIQKTDPLVRIELAEDLKKQYLSIQPKFVYNDRIVNSDDEIESIKLFENDVVTTYLRNIEFEQSVIHSIASLHLQFEDKKQFTLSFKECIHDAWFVKAIKQLQEYGYGVYGIDKLTHLNISPFEPEWKMKTSSGLDWFDLEVEVSFDDEVVGLTDIRKAIMEGSFMIRLNNGSLGLIPQKWAKKYGMILKLGEVSQDGNIKVSKLHFTLIDELYDEIDERLILEELSEKKNKLANIEHVKNKKLSKHINATLRSYQLNGLYWLQTLEELGWGACLADDMGLGKTLQSIAFIQYLKDKYKKILTLVVCPTSLVYNWQAELIKFAPKLKFKMYYGSDRNFDLSTFSQYDIIITSYGNLRSDIDDFKEVVFTNIILDESQAIKNPNAQITKCVQLLKAKTKLILSGTPLQNNTFDLYAQFQFLNPGLLGNKEFFRTEFANVIDKQNDVEKSAYLRKIVYPFLLRRTKEQVASDLPAKIESILYCEMGTKQRKVYDEYKAHYREMILQKIDDIGMAKSGMYVLEGLLRLRQICDSPVLVKNQKVTSTESIKIEELLREITENTGDNKVLIFSQFTGMLALIGETLEKNHLPYLYLDGKVKAVDRKKLVDDFQTSNEVKLFLISLKTGGVGLNLTAANYVYIVDPWWNPAVEQQAIDRTHRIGQVNKIFSYKMICKDTVEEKIIQLQQNKKQLANELITEDAGFFKKLKREDVAFLFE